MDRYWDRGGDGVGMGLMDACGGLYQYQGGVDGCMGVGGSEGTGKVGGREEGRAEIRRCHSLSSTCHLNQLPAT